MSHNPWGLRRYISECNVNHMDHEYVRSLVLFQFSTKVKKKHGMCVLQKKRDQRLVISRNTYHKRQRDNTAINE